MCDFLPSENFMLREPKSASGMKRNCNFCFSGEFRMYGCTQMRSGECPPNPEVLPFLCASPGPAGRGGAVGALSPLEFMDWWAQLHLWEENLHGEPRAKMKAGFKSSLHMCCSSIEEMSWWELIPALEEILGGSKMILIHAVDPNHPLPRDQLVGSEQPHLCFPTNASQPSPFSSPPFKEGFGTGSHKPSTPRLATAGFALNLLKMTTATER
ncbi:uncharacterized protein LOC119701664 [Motacilla alba alba]|uniref:uncharacterized protein LOC119701664 n=1 Tax=Motacilla alba alba TaxID=1094192 RepID=UPI0018D5678E|nr:uncharacterized protein LOC119701664 [Motacilla alba alba]